MAAHHTNPYFVTKQFNSSGSMQANKSKEWQDIVDRDIERAKAAQKDAEVAFRRGKTAKQCFQELKNDTVHYSKYPESAEMDESTRMYTCYFFRDGLLMSGTTYVKPKQGAMTNLWASEYGIVGSKPGNCEIHSQNSYVLWRTL